MKKIRLGRGAPISIPNFVEDEIFLAPLEPGELNRKVMNTDEQFMALVGIQSRFLAYLAEHGMLKPSDLHEIVTGYKETSVTYV